MTYEQVELSPVLLIDKDIKPFARHAYARRRAISTHISCTRILCPYGAPLNLGHRACGNTQGRGDPRPTDGP